MHEHHEQEMTPSTLSYQLRDTIVDVIIRVRSAREMRDISGSMLA